jgi:hypothetical protein
LNYLRWLGINQEQLIQGEVFSEEVLIPRDGACQDLLYNRWELQSAREFIFKRAGLSDRLERTHDPESSGSDLDSAVTPHFPQVSRRGTETHGASVQGPAWMRGRKPLMVLLGRSKLSKFTARKSDIPRIWTSDFFNEVFTALGSAFPQFEVVAYSDRNETMMRCIECQVELFSRTSVLIGMHGAGFTNSIFMPPGGAIVEIVPSTEGRMNPASGIFSRFAMATGVHHLIYPVPPDKLHFSRKGTSFPLHEVLAYIQQNLPKLPLSFAFGSSG